MPVMPPRQYKQQHPRQQQSSGNKESVPQSRLQSLRSQKGYTQIRVQIETGIDQSDYSKIERGQRPPTYEQAIQLAQLFETSVDYLCGLTDEPRPYPRSSKK